MNRPHTSIVRAFAFVSVVAASRAAHAQCDAYVLQPTPWTTGADPRGVAFGLLDADAYVDAVVPQYLADDVQVLLGTSSGFAAPTPVAAGTRALAAKIGDLDGDGDLDIAVCNEGQQSGSGWIAYGVTVLWNASGGFPTSSFLALPSSAIQPRDLALGDFDGDQDLDLALVSKGVGTNHSKLASFVNLGAQSFAAANVTACGYDPVALRLGDVDGDQVLDAVTVNNYSGTINVLHGVGDGTFTLAWGHSAGTYPGDLTLGDFDGDQDLDCAVAYRYGVMVLDNVGGTFAFVTSLTAGTYPYSVACADFDGDGTVDLASTCGLTDMLYVFDGSGTGNFALRTSFVVGDNPFGSTAYDVDRDGDTDLGVVAYNDDAIVIVDNTCPLSTYCVGKVNSQGCTPSIGSTGTPSVSGPDDFHVTATQELPQKNGLVFVGAKAAALPFSGGTLCVKPPLKRASVQNSGGAGACTGVYDQHLTNAWFASKGFLAGSDLFTQYWSRDPQHPDGTGVALSNGLRFVLQP